MSGQQPIGVNVYPIGQSPLPGGSGGDPGKVVVAPSLVVPALVVPALVVPISVVKGGLTVGDGLVDVPVVVLVLVLVLVLVVGKLVVLVVVVGSCVVVVVVAQSAPSHLPSPHESGNCCLHHASTPSGGYVVFQ